MKAVAAHWSAGSLEELKKVARKKNSWEVLMKQLKKTGKTSWDLWFKNTADKFKLLGCRMLTGKVGDEVTLQRKQFETDGSCRWCGKEKADIIHTITCPWMGERRRIADVRVDELLKSIGMDHFDRTKVLKKWFVGDGQYDRRQMCGVVMGLVDEERVKLWKQTAIDSFKADAERDNGERQKGKKRNK